MLQKLLADIARVLNAAKIPYMIIGGQAVLIYGEPRVTRDIDITLGLDDSHTEEILSIGATLQLQTAVKDINEFVKKTNVLPLYDPRSGFRVDFIFSFSPYEQEALSRICVIEIENQQIKFASVEDIIIHKMIAGRPRDIEDIKGILAHQRNSIDFKYIERWLVNFSESLKINFADDFTGIISGINHH
jgi:predicted nucleotidyltransferase